MDAYRKYFSDEQLHELEAAGPNWGVNVHTVGHHVHPAGKSYPDPEHPSSHAFKWREGRKLQEFQIVYIANGQGVFESREAGRLAVKEGTIMLHFPGIWHRYKPDRQTGWEEFWVGFDGHYAEYLMRQDCFDPSQPLINLGFNIEFVEVFLRLIETVRHEGVAHRQISSCLVIQLLGLVYASALMKNKTRLHKEQVVHAIRLRMHKDWDQALDLNALAAEHNVSYEWFRKAFKQVVGVSPNQYQQNLKLDKASQMLRETALTVAEVAHLTGHGNEFYFSRIFKKKTGYSPSEYRLNAS
ncbi:MAG: AraC family transcriptional regulator [Lewinella sp.]|nr:AraC family transcriptional regulator [Lewinella sp.]